MASQSSAPRYPQDSNTSYPPAARPPPITWDGFSHDPDLSLSAAPSGLRSYPSYLSTASSSSPYPDALTNLGYPSFSSDPRPLPAARTTSSLGGESDPEKDDAPHFREVAIEDDGYNHPASSHGFHSGGKGESVGEHARRKMTLRRAVGEAAGGATRGGWRKIIPSTLVTRLYIGLVALQTVVDMAIQGNLLVQYLALDTTGPISSHSDAQTLRLPVYLGIFALAHLFLLVMALDAVKARNTIQIVGLCLFNAMFLVYAIIQIDEIRQVFDGTDSDELAKDKIPVTLLTTLIPTMIGLCEIGYLILSWFCWREMGWDIYKSMGADRRLKRLFFHYQVFLCICKFSFFFFLGFSIQLIYLVLDRDWEFWLTIIALPFSLLILLLGWMSARYEYRWGMGILQGTLVVLGAYYVLKLTRIWQSTETLLTIVKSLTVFAVLSLILVILTSAYTVVVWRGFGLGLKEGLDRKTQNDNLKKKGGLADGGQTGGRYPLGPTHTKRMSIE